MTATGKRRWSVTRVNFWFDILIFVVALLSPALLFTGLPVHEWMTIGLGVAIIVHLLLHWQWIVETIRRYFGRTTWSARLNFIVNALFFIVMTIAIFSGLMISRVALPQLGISVQPNFMWRPLHTISSDAMILILAVHIGLHANWIVDTTKRYLIKPIFGRGGKHAAAGAVVEKEGVA